MHDENRKITVEILKKNGFTNITDEDEADFWKENGCKHFSEWEKATSKHYISMRYGICNSNCDWTLQVDNINRDSVAMFEIDYTWQFDMLMMVLMEDFSLN